MWVGLIFAVAMAIIGWISIAQTGWEPVAIIAGVFGTVFLGLAIYGWQRRSLYLLAGGVLGTGIAFPTTFGIVPMIIGFVIFALLISLRMFNDLDLGKDKK